MGMTWPLWRTSGENVPARTCGWGPTESTALEGEVRGTPSFTGLLDARGQFLHQVVHRPVLADEARDLVLRVDHRGVVAPTELLADHRQRRVGELAREVHRHLAGIRDCLRSPRAHELVERDAEALRDGLLDPRDRDLGRRRTLRVDVLEDVLGELDGHRPIGQRRERDDARERALELADVRRDATGDERQHLGVGRPRSAPCSPSCAGSRSASRGPVPGCRSAGPTRTASGGAPRALRSPAVAGRTR